MVAFRQKVVPKVLKFSSFFRNILYVGNDDGSVNILSTKSVKAVQTIRVCSSAVISILEMDESTLLVIGVEGDMALLYPASECENSEELQLAFTNFPDLNNRITCVAQSPVEPEYRFLICTANGFVTTYIRTSDIDGLKKGISSEFTAVDNWNVMSNPHGLMDEREIALNEKLYKNTQNVGISAAFRCADVHKHIVGVVDVLQ